MQPIWVEALRDGLIILSVIISYVKLVQKLKVEVDVLREWQQKHEEQSKDRDVRIRYAELDIARQQEISKSINEKLDRIINHLERQEAQK